MQCTTKLCFSNKENGDLFFCRECRKKWRDFCKLSGIEFIPLKEDETNIILNNFQKRLEK
jgi:hypothetical protein